MTWQVLHGYVQHPYHTMYTPTRIYQNLLVDGDIILVSNIVLASITKLHFPFKYNTSFKL